MKLLITIVLALVFASIVSNIAFSLLNSFVKLPNVINHYGGLVLFIYILIKCFSGVKSFVASNL